MNSKFIGVNVVRAANVYYDGKVTSRSLEFPDGTVRTLGIMLPGEYSFATSSPELVEVNSGFVLVQLPESEQWLEKRAGDSFQVPGDSTFRVFVQQLLDYTCTYL